MPFNPEDPNSETYKPLGTSTSFIPLTADPVAVAEEAVRMCFPQSTSRNQVPEALETVEKLHKLWSSYRDRQTSKTDTIIAVDALIQPAITRNIFDDVCLEFVNNAVSAVKNVNL